MNSRHECDLSPAAIHRRLDGDPVEQAELSRLEAHLTGCERCRELDEELRAIQEGLRALPAPEFPEDAFERVLRQTAGKVSRAWLPAWAAVAAATLIVALAGWWATQPSQRGPTDAELARASQQARLVLKLASDALKRTERVAFHDVVGDELGAALRRAPVDWPDTSAGQRRGS